MYCGGGCLAKAPLLVPRSLLRGPCGWQISINLGRNQSRCLEVDLPRKKNDLTVLKLDLGGAVEGEM